MGRQPNIEATAEVASGALPQAARLLLAMSESGVSDEVLGRTVRELLKQPEKWLEQPQEPIKDASISRPASRRRQLAMVKFRNDQGVESSVSISLTLLRDFARASGGIKEARTTVKELAQRAPKTSVNRSGWVTDQLARRLAQLTAQRTAERSVLVNTTDAEGPATSLQKQADDDGSQPLNGGTPSLF